MGKKIRLFKYPFAVVTSWDLKTSNMKFLHSINHSHFFKKNYIFIGGTNSGSPKTYYFSLKTNKWISAPEMLQPRKFHTASVVTDSITKQDCILVVGGEYKNESSNTFHIHNTIEVFDKVENQWKLGNY